MSLLEQFTEVTISVIRTEGLNGYLPTIVVPATELVRVIEGVPQDADHRKVLLDAVAGNKLQESEFFFGVQTGPKEITTGHYAQGRVQFMSIVETGGEYQMRPLEVCEWWQLGG